MFLDCISFVVRQSFCCLRLLIYWVIVIFLDLIALKLMLGLRLNFHRTVVYSLILSNDTFISFSLF